MPIFITLKESLEHPAFFLTILQITLHFATKFQYFCGVQEWWRNS